jgi:hypothetical protein
LKIELDEPLAEANLRDPEAEAYSARERTPLPSPGTGVSGKRLLESDAPGVRGREKKVVDTLRARGYLPDPFSVGSAGLVLEN